MKFFLNSNKPYTIAGVFWCVAFACITFDRIFTLEVSGFTIKSYYWLFFAGFVLLLVKECWSSGCKTLCKSILDFLSSSPWRYLVILLIFSSLCAPLTALPKKALGYSLWGWFNLFTIIFTARLLKNKFDRRVIEYAIFLSLASAVCFLSAVVIFDHIVYFFEIPDGIVGFNQDTEFQINISRPHAFAYEPSYLATYLSIALIFVFFYLVFLKKEILSPAFNGLTLFLGSVALVILMSRTGLISFIAGIALLFLYLFKKLKHDFRFPWKIFAGVVLVSILFYFCTPKVQRDGVYDFFITPMVTLKASSGTARLRSMWIGYQIFKETNFLGTGAGNSFYYWVSTNLERPAGRDIEEVINADGIMPKFFGGQVIMSTWSELLAEQGLFGFVLYLCFAVSLVRRLKISARNEVFSMATPAFISALIFFLFTAHWLPNFFRSDVWVWYALWDYYKKV